MLLPPDVPAILGDALLVRIGFRSAERSLGLVNNVVVSDVVVVQSTG